VTPSADAASQMRRGVLSSHVTPLSPTPDCHQSSPEVIVYRAYGLVNDGGFCCDAPECQRDAE